PVGYSQVENRSGSMQSMNLNLYDIDYDFMQQYGLKLDAGRGFSTAFPSDSTKAFIINETAVKDLGYAHPQDAIGKRFSQWGRTGQIIGVVKDFHFQSLQQDIKEMDLRINTKNIGVFTLKIR